MADIEEILAKESDPKILFEYRMAIQKYFRKSIYENFETCVRREQFDIPFDEKIFKKIDELRAEKCEDRRKVKDNDIVEHLDRRVFFLVESNALFEKIEGGENNRMLSEIMSYSELILFSELVAMYLYLKEISKTKFYAILSMFKDPTNDLALRDNPALLRPLFAIKIASIGGVDDKVLYFFDCLSQTIKTPKDYALLKVFIDSVYVNLSSYSGSSK